MSTGVIDARCDWYSASVDTTAPVLIDCLSEGLDGVVRPATPHNGYHVAAEIVSGDTRLAVVSWGGVNPRPSVMASGSTAGRVMELLRSRFPHSVSRMDSAVDLCGAGVFDSIVQDVITMLDGHDFRGVRPKISQVGDWVHGHGRTLYVGSRTSRAFLRVYEKTAERLAAGDRNVPDNWVRCELEFKPANAAEKRRASSMSPEDCWRASGWTRRVWEVMDDTRLAALPVPIRQRSTRARAVAAVLRQYGPTFRGIRDEMSDADFSRWFLRALDASTSNDFDAVINAV